MPTSVHQQQSPKYHRYNQTWRFVTKDTDSEIVEYNEEREEEEYIYAPKRSPSTASDTATIQFLTDDRLETGGQERQTSQAHFKTHRLEERQRMEASKAGMRSDSRSGAKDDWNNNSLQSSNRLRDSVADYSTTSTTSAAVNWEFPEESRQRAQPTYTPSSYRYSPHQSPQVTTQTTKTTRTIVQDEQEEEKDEVEYKVTRHQHFRHYDRPSTASSTLATEKKRDMSVDYSTQDFQHSRAVIDTAAKQENVRVKKVGDTTIISEHRDPYSFYWQLDQVRKKESDPPRRQPPLTDYVIDEEEIVQETTVLSPDSHDSGVNFVESQYSKPIKEEVRQLPAGWEKHEDPSGFSYYWHVDSGTIQREPPRVSNRPETAEQPVRSSSPPLIYAKQPKPVIAQPERVVSPQASPQPPAQPVIEEHAFKQITTKRQIENQDEETSADLIDEEDKKSVRFLVRSLGWTEISENDLTADRSSRAVNKAIMDLSTGSQENTSKWGSGKELIMELNDNELLLIDPDTLETVHSEKIQQIRVWGVGRDNGRDFAYVARDRNSRRFLCHVFRCDTPARNIANTLRDICKRLMNQRQTQSFTPASPSEPSERRIVRESSLVVPIDGARKVIRCHFLGVTQVPRATGIDVLNEAVDRLVSQVKSERWLLADVAIALSTITITEVGGGQIAQCRVRYLSFLGIGQDIKHCAFIIHTSSENFMCYVFHVEPSAAMMAKTIEGACKLRYQKILDSNIPRSHLAVNNNNRIRYYDY